MPKGKAPEAADNLHPRSDSPKLVHKRVSEAKSEPVSRSSMSEGKERKKKGTEYNKILSLALLQLLPLFFFLNFAKFMQKNLVNQLLREKNGSEQKEQKNWQPH
jgi:hypothetical protein